MTLRVKLQDRSYAIIVRNSFENLPRHLGLLGLSKHGWVISHRNLLSQYGQDFLRPLRRTGWTLHTICIPESERSKSLATVHWIIRKLVAKASLRVPVLFAFGGGVVGDVTGFVAAVFRRGVPYVQVPTTLLAQVDSSIGGKVGVDLPEGKNLLGAFYQPRLVYENLSLLQTLPMRQRRSGLAEVIKCGLIADPDLFTFVEENLEDCLSLHTGAVRVMVERSCLIKARAVSNDERETRTVRAQLNFGHTLGHALEAATNYQRWTHGEAITIGMCAAARLSCELGWLSASSSERIHRLVRSAGLPIRSTGVSRNRVRQAMRYDKKFVHGRPRWVLLREIGRVSVTEAVTTSLIERIVREYVV